MKSRKAHRAPTLTHPRYLARTTAGPDLNSWGHMTNAPDFNLDAALDATDDWDDFESGYADELVSADGPDPGGPRAHHR